MKRKRLSNKAVIFLCLVVAVVLFGVAALLDSQRTDNPRYIIDGGKKVYCEELYDGKTAEGLSFQICLPTDRVSYRDSVVILNGKRTNTLEASRLRDGGTTSVQTAAGTFFFPAPSLEEPTPQATFENEPLLVWRTK